MTDEAQQKNDSFTPTAALDLFFCLGIFSTDTFIFLPQLTFITSHNISIGSHVSLKRQNLCGGCWAKVGYLSSCDCDLLTLIICVLFLISMNCQEVTVIVSKSHELNEPRTDVLSFFVTVKMWGGNVIFCSLATVFSGQLWGWKVKVN